MGAPITPYSQGLLAQLCATPAPSVLSGHHARRWNPHKRCHYGPRSDSLHHTRWFAEVKQEAALSSSQWFPISALTFRRSFVWYFSGKCCQRATTLQLKPPGSHGSPLKEQAFFPPSPKQMNNSFRNTQLDSGDPNHSLHRAQTAWRAALKTFPHWGCHLLPSL